MTQTVNADALAIADSNEGCCLYTYDDATGLRIFRTAQKIKGRLTAGYGHTGRDLTPGMTVTQAMADAWRADDMAHAAAFVASKVRVPLNGNEFSALAEFTFNVGTGNFAGSTLLRRLNKGDYAAVPSQLARWNRSTVGGRQIVLPGLAKRRAEEAALFVTPVDRVAPAPVPLQPIMAAARPAAPSLVERVRAWLHTTTQGRP